MHEAECDNRVDTNRVVVADSTRSEEDALRVLLASTFAPWNANQHILFEVVHIALGFDGFFTGALIAFALTPIENRDTPLSCVLLAATFTALIVDGTTHNYVTRVTGRSCCKRRICVAPVLSGVTRTLEFFFFGLFVVLSREDIAKSAIYISIVIWQFRVNYLKPLFDSLPRMAFCLDKFKLLSPEEYDGDCSRDLRVLKGFNPTIRDRKKLPVAVAGATMGVMSWCVTEPAVICECMLGCMLRVISGNFFLDSTLHGGAIAWVSVTCATIIAIASILLHHRDYLGPVAFYDDANLWKLPVFQVSLIAVVHVVISLFHSNLGDRGLALGTISMWVVDSAMKHIRKLRVRAFVLEEIHRRLGKDWSHAPFHLSAAPPRRNDVVV